MIFDVTTMTCWKLRWQHFFNKVFSKLTGFLSLLWCFTLKRLKYSGTQCFACTWKPKNSYDLLYWNICSIAVAWNQNLNISGVCLYSWYHPSLVSTDNVIMLTFSSKWFHPKLFSCTMANIAATELNHNSSVAQLWSTLCSTPWTAACQASLSITNSRSLPKLMSIDSVIAI